MSVFNFYKTPLIFGNPSQQIITDETKLFQLIAENSGERPVFISHNSYPTFNNDEPYQIEVSKLFSDFDSKPKPENAQLDALKLSNFCDENHLPHIICFSGNKGFHVYIALKPETYVYNETLKAITKGVHLWLKKKLNLRTLDTRTCEPKRLCRVFYTPHISLDKRTNHPISNGLYCCPLLPEWIQNWNIRQILEYAKNPTRISYDPLHYKDWDAKLLTLYELVEALNIDVQQILDEYREVSSSEYKATICSYQPVEDTFIKSLIPKPCIHSQIIHNPNPPHIIRFSAAIQLRDLGYSKSWVFNFIQDRNYIDKHNTKTCAQQINNIYDHLPLYKHPTCRTLYNEGFCVGSICPRYSEDII